jgi:uroporphyrinogen-III synthase
MTAGELSGRCIVLTRPHEHAAGLADRIRAAGGEPLVFPAIEILPPEDSDALARVIARLEDFQLAIFISRTAAAKGHAAVTARRGWPKDLRVAAVGAGTAATLRRLGFDAVIAPGGQADSEALAALPELQDLRGKSVVVFRGQGGREWLRAALETRGARVDYAECYRRMRPAADTGPLLARWQRGEITAVSITSAEGLTNFLDMLGPAGKDCLCATPVFVPHPRVAEAAARLGLREVIVAGSGDEQTVASMAAFFARVRV